MWRFVSSPLLVNLWIVEVLSSLQELRPNLQLPNWSVSIEEWIPLFSTVQERVGLDLQLTHNGAFIEDLHGDSVLEGLLVVDPDVVLFIEHPLVTSSLFRGLRHTLEDDLHLWVSDVLNVNVLET